MNSFSLKVAEFAKAAEIDVIKTARLIVLQVFNSVVQRTPVLTGRAKGSWTVGVYTLPTSFREVEDKSPKGTMSGDSTREIAVKAGAWDANSSIYLVSNLEYMPNLEYGGSKQAPAGMVRVTIAEFDKMINDAIRQAK